ncbi:MAG TPA: TIGR03118 family protein [Terriglobales bacterium]|nr:TIGR03118 family protein [Terriglobales bacterium]
MRSESLQIFGRQLVCALAVVLAFTTLSSAQAYKQTNLVSDVNNINGVPTNPTQPLDKLLVNPWGMSASAGSPLWVSDNGTGVSTLYNGAGVKQGLVVTIPVPAGQTTPATPTGTVFNSSGSTTAFSVSANGKTGKAAFLFATEDGIIAGWSPAVDQNNAIIAVPNSKTPAPAIPPIYKGLALANDGLRDLLYAANFASGKVEVYDTTFAPVTPTGGFVDRDLPSGFAPFNIQNINGALYVTFAKQGPEGDELHGPGLGRVDVFDANGNLLKQLQHGGWLNAPWGVALAPAGFGFFSKHLLVGNFGSGTIAAYDLASGRFDGLLRDANNKFLVIDGLWALRFGNTGAAAPPTTLFFTAGPDDEHHGLFGTLTPIGDQSPEDNGDDR